MAIAVYPTLIGLKWDQSIAPEWHTDDVKTASGVEFRTSYQQYPINKFSFAYDYLSPTDLLTHKGFFNQQQGKGIPFFLNATNDNTVSTYAFGTTAVGQQNYTILKPAGTGAAEPIGGVNGTLSLFVDGVAAPAAGLATPSAPTLAQVASGALGATTNYVKITWLNYWGETIASVEASLVTSANNVVKVTQPTPPAGAVYWNVYLATTAHGGTGNEKLQSTGTNIPVATTTWQEPNTGWVTGAAPPGANTTGWTLNAQGNILILGAAATVATHILSWTGSYYYYVRFDDDSLEYNQFASGYYEIKKCNVVQVF